MIDGDGYRPDSFTSMLLPYLDSRDDFKVYAIMLDDANDMKEFTGSWPHQLSALTGRIAMVPIKLAEKHAGLSEIVGDLTSFGRLQGWQQAYVLLGVIAVLATKAGRILAIGGGPVARVEAELADLIIGRGTMAVAVDDDGVAKVQMCQSGGLLMLSMAIFNMPWNGSCTPGGLASCEFNSRERIDVTGSTVDEAVKRFHSDAKAIVVVVSGWLSLQPYDDETCTPELHGEVLVAIASWRRILQWVWAALLIVALRIRVYFRRRSHLH